MVWLGDIVRDSGSLTSPHLSLNREGRWGTTLCFHNQFPQFFSVLHRPLGLGELQACPIPDVVFHLFFCLSFLLPPFTLPCKMVLARPDERGDLPIPLQFASFYRGQEIFVWSNILLDLGTHFLVGIMVFV